MELVNSTEDVTQDVLKQRFTTLVAQHEGIVHKVASTYCWHPDDRADVTQEILTQLWRAFPRYDDERTFSTWMYRIALNVAISYVRAHTRRGHHHVPFDERVDEVPAGGGSDPDVEFLYGFIETLDPLNKAVLLLYLEERSYREIADVLGITETNVATKISRLKQRLRRASESPAPTEEQSQ